MKAGRRGTRSAWRTPCGRKTLLGRFLHLCGDDAVVRVCSEDIPCPGAPVFASGGTRVGAVDEVFGPVDETYASIKPDRAGLVWKEGDTFLVAEDRLIRRARLLSRKDAEERKERADRRATRKRPDK